MQRDTNPLESNGEFLKPFQGGAGLWEELPNIPLALFKDNRDRLVAALKAEGVTSGVVVLQGGEEEPRYSSDVEYDFIQEAFFLWAFGVQEPGFYGAIDIASGKSAVFCPELPESYEMWFGQLYPPTFFQKKYGVATADYTKNINKTLEEWKTEIVYLNRGKNTDSGATTLAAKWDGVEQFSVNYTKLHPAITECRVHKNKYEADMLRFACRISSKAHVELMQTLKPGMGEFQASSLFTHLCYFKGALRTLHYGRICASGIDNAVLHYPMNNKIMQAGSLCLFDMGAEYEGYGADITCSFPIDGKFTQPQQDIYNAVLDANNSILDSMKPGVCWADLHKLAYERILTHMKRLGLVKGEVAEMMENWVGAAFMPHGMGHLIGIDVHDVGGYNKGAERIDAPGIRHLRTTRNLEEGMFITVEPGCYFNQVTLQKAFKDPVVSKYLVEEAIRDPKYWNLGGVRIEENVLVTKDGSEVFTSVPRTVEEIQAVMAGGSWEHNNAIRSPK